MAIALEGFKVVTEFVFNADQALNAAEKLNQQVDKLSTAAEMAVDSITQLGISYAMSFSGATGGILGILGKAIKSSDKFRSTQIELANTMIANGMKMEGGVMTFNDALEQSHFIMDKIVKKARDFGISPDAFTSQVKFFNNMLAPKGLSGTNLSDSIEIARVSMKAAPALGVSNDQAMGGILAGISGQLSKQAQFGRRLFMESGDVIKEETGIGNLKEFNKAKPAKRIKALIVGLDKLAGTADAVAARADTLGSRLMQIRDLFSGVGSILRPLGDVILPLIKDTIDFALAYLKNEGAEVVKEMAIFVKGIVKGPREMLVDLMQLKELSKDLGIAIGIGGIALLMAHSVELLSFLGSNQMTKGFAGVIFQISLLIGKIPVLGQVLRSLFTSFNTMFSIDFSAITKAVSGAGITSFGTFLTSIPKLIIPAFKTLWSLSGVFLRMAGFVGILLIPLQGISKAFAMMKLESIGFIASKMPHIAKGLNKLKHSFDLLMTPINEMIDGWAAVALGIFGGTNGLQLLVDAFDFVVDGIASFSMAILELWALFKGLVGGISAVIGTIAGGGIFSGDLMENFVKAMGDEFDKTLNNIRTPTLGPDGEGKTVTNYVEQHNTLNNNFKEVLQPDRIAFTIVEQLEKAARNRVSGSGGLGLAGGSSSSSKLSAGF